MRKMTILLTLFSIFIISPSAFAETFSFPKKGKMPITSFSYDGFDVLLKKYVKNGLVNYDAVKKNEKAVLNKIYTGLAQISPLEIVTRDEKFAFWINTYNFLCLFAICRGNSPTTSAEREILFKTGKHVVGTVPLSLDDIENKILRKDFYDARIHFALVCGALSCPPLRSGIYHSTVIRSELEEQANIFLNDTRKNYIDHGKKIIYASEIIKWFSADFTSTFGEIHHIFKIYSKQAQGDISKYSIRYLPYQWLLNSQN